MKRLFSLGVAVFLFSAPLFAQSFGSAVAVSGDEIIAGGRTNAITAGVLYRYHQESDGSWKEIGSISASESDASGNGFGRSVAVSGETMIVGAPGAKMAYIFSRSSDGSWVEVQGLTSEVDGFGGTVATL